jgi:hypothetical protein
MNKKFEWLKIDSKKDNSHIVYDCDTKVKKHVICKPKDIFIMKTCKDKK